MTSSARKSVINKARAKAEPATQETVRDAAVGWRRMRNGKGRGVFARRAFRKGELIEIAPVIPVGADAVPAGEAPDGYLLDWDPDTKGQEHAMVLGYVMLYNHSDKPNLDLESDMNKMTVTVRAARDIRTGEELCWNYSCDLWFEEI